MRCCRSISSPGSARRALTVGVIEGIAEATALIVQDLLRRAQRPARPPQVACGRRAMGSRPSPSRCFRWRPRLGWLFAARFIDRIGKGIRGAPRDALIADITPPSCAGQASGCASRSTPSAPSSGRSLAIGLMLLTADNFTLVFWFAVIPALLSFAVIVFGVHEPERPAELAAGALAARRVREIARLGRRVLGRGRARRGLFTLARFSEAFLLLRAQSVGMALALVPADPGGDEHRLCARRLARRRAVGPGRALRAARLRLCDLIVADLVLAFAPNVAAVVLGAALWGLHMGLTQGILASLVADTAPPDLRGTAFGMFNLAAGIATVAASVIAGALVGCGGAAGHFRGRRGLHGAGAGGGPAAAALCCQVDVTSPDQCHESNVTWHPPLPFLSAPV